MCFSLAILTHADSHTLLLPSLSAPIWGKEESLRFSLMYCTVHLGLCSELYAAHIYTDWPHNIKTTEWTATVKEDADHIITLQCSAEKYWDLQFTWMLFWLPLQAWKRSNVEEPKTAVPLMPTWSWLKKKEKPHRLPEPEDDLTVALSIFSVYDITHLLQTAHHPCQHHPPPQCKSSATA